MYSQRSAAPTQSQKQNQRAHALSAHHHQHHQQQSDASLVIPGLEARPLRANPEFYKADGLARSRNSVVDIQQLHDQFVSSASVSASGLLPSSSSSSPHPYNHRGGEPLHLEGGQRSPCGGGGYHHRRPSLSLSLATNNSSRELFYQQQQLQQRLAGQLGASGNRRNSKIGAVTTTRQAGMQQQQQRRRQAAANHGGAAAGGLPKPVNYNDLLRREQQPQLSSRIERGGGGEGHAVSSADQSPHSGGSSSSSNQHQRGFTPQPPQQLQQQQQQQQQYAPEDPRSRLLAYSGSNTNTNANNSSNTNRSGSGSNDAVATSNINTDTNTSSGGSGGFMEGPLPPEVRAIISAQFTAIMSLGTAHSSQAAVAMEEEAERQARRLLSTSRRVKVYRDELAAASAEAADLEGVFSQHTLVVSALGHEVSDIDAKIAQLMAERRLCEQQLEQQQGLCSRQAGKLREARERVSVLHGTIENITAEAQTGQTVLRQLVPNLNIENYV